MIGTCEVEFNNSSSFSFIRAFTQTQIESSIHAQSKKSFSNCSLKTSILNLLIHSSTVTSSYHTVIPTHRRRAIHSLPKKKSMKQSVSCVRMNVNKKVIMKEEFAREQNIFRLSSRWVDEAEASPELVEMWNLRRANPIVSLAEIDDRSGREGRHLIGTTTNSTLLALVEII
jgi:hypothetical protein